MNDTLICNRQQLTDALNITQRHIDNLIGAGIVVKIGRGEYDVIQSCKNYVKFLRGSNTAEKLDLTEERTRLTRYQADLTLINLQTARRENVPLHIVKLWTARLITSLKSQLLALPSNIAVNIPHLEKTDYVKIDDMIRTTLEEASKTPVPRELQKAFDAHEAEDDR